MRKGPAARGAFPVPAIKVRGVLRQALAPTIGAMRDLADAVGESAGVV